MNLAGDNSFLSKAVLFRYTARFLMTLVGLYSVYLCYYMLNRSHLATDIDGYHAVDSQESALFLPLGNQTAARFNQHVTAISKKYGEAAQTSTTNEANAEQKEKELPLCRNADNKEKETDKAATSSDTTTATTPTPTPTPAPATTPTTLVAPFDSELYSSLYGDGRDSEGLGWEYHPPFPFQRHSVIEPSVIQVPVGGRWRFRLTGYDIRRQRVTRGDDRWEMWAKGEGGGVHDVRFRPEKVIDHKDGTYTLEGLAPPFPGKYVVRTGLTHINMTEAACEWNWMQRFINYNQEYLTGGWNPQWTRWTKEELKTCGHNPVVSSLPEKDLINYIYVLPLDEWKQKQAALPEAEQKALANTPTHLLAAEPPATPLLSEEQRPLCTDNDEKYGYSVGAFFSPYACRYRTDDGFIGACRQQHRGKRIALVGTSLENRMMASLQRHVSPEMSVEYVYLHSHVKDYLDIVRRVVRDFDIIFFELIVHEVEESCPYFEEKVMPVVSQILFHDPTVERKPGHRIIWCSGSYVQGQYMHHEWRYASAWTNADRIERANKISRKFLPANIPYFDRFIASSPLVDKTNDNVHYSADWDDFNSRLLFSALCPHSNN